MRHGVVGKRLGRDTAHRKAMLNNLATSVLAQGLKEEPMDRQVVTTVQKAKVVRGLVDRLITYAKQGDLPARRQAARFVKDKLVLRGLFETLGKRYGKRVGGYSRVLKVSANRHGDNADMALITLVEEEIRPRPKKKVPKVKVKAEKKVNITKAEGKVAPAQTESIPHQPTAEPPA
jgi:large subunit ribosomal protein L17